MTGMRQHDECGRRESPAVYRLAARVPDCISSQLMAKEADPSSARRMAPSAAFTALLFRLIRHRAPRGAQKRDRVY